MATWELYAHRSTWPLRYHHFGKDRSWVQLHSLNDPIVKVAVTEIPRNSIENPLSPSYWGWVGEGTDHPVMIWHSRTLFECQFIYGPYVEEERGKGRVVQLTVREVEE